MKHFEDLLTANAMRHINFVLIESTIDLFFLKQFFSLLFDE